MPAVAVRRPPQTRRPIQKTLHLDIGNDDTAQFRLIQPAVSKPPRKLADEKVNPLELRQQVLDRTTEWRGAVACLTPNRCRRSARMRAHSPPRRVARGHSILWPPAVH